METIRELFENPPGKYRKLVNKEWIEANSSGFHDEWIPILLRLLNEYKDSKTDHEVFGKILAHPQTGGKTSIFSLEDRPGGGVELSIVKYKGNYHRYLETEVIRPMLFRNPSEIFSDVTHITPVKAKVNKVKFKTTFVSTLAGSDKFFKTSAESLIEYYVMTASDEIEPRLDYLNWYKMNKKEINYDGDNATPEMTVVAMLSYFVGDNGIALLAKDPFTIVNELLITPKYDKDGKLLTVPRFEYPIVYDNKVIVRDEDHVKYLLNILESGGIVDIESITGIGGTPPQPGAPGAPGAPATPATTKDKYAQAITSMSIPADSPSDKLVKIYEVLTNRFKFPSELDAKIFVAGCLVKNNKQSLKGTPGTGKTTLILSLLSLFFNPDNWDWSATDPVSGSLVNFDSYFNALRISQKEYQKYGMNWNFENKSYAFWEDANGHIVPAYFTNPGEVMKEMECKECGGVVKYVLKNAKHKAPIFGQSKNNPDKTADDILYYTDISLNEYMLKSAMAQAVKTNPGDPGPDWKNIKQSIYDFSPMPRDIVTSLVKLHNESNRMNRSVQDAVLGLMAEKEVEYLGSSMFSPTGISFFDYNPHLDWGGEKLDMAFLDRIDTSIYFSANDFKHSYEIAKTTTLASRGTKRIQDLIVDDIQSGDVKPFTVSDIMKVWDEVQTLVTIPKAVVLYAIGILGFFKNPYRVYGEAYENVKPFSFKGKKKWVDITELTYYNAREQEPMVKSQFGDSAIAKINDIRRPLGYRALRSLLVNAKAFAYLEHAMGKRSDLIVTYTDVDLFIPYVSEHRIGVGGTEKILQREFLNFGDFIRGYFNPKVLKQCRDDIIAVCQSYVEGEEQGLKPRALRKKVGYVIEDRWEEEPVMYRYFTMLFDEELYEEKNKAIW